MGLRQVLLAFLDHRMEVLIRRSRYRLGKIADRLEVLAAYRIAYLNLDEVIRIIREEDDPKTGLMRAFELSERQAEAILNMRLRNLRKLEEQALSKEERGLKGEQRELNRLLKDEGERRQRLKGELEATLEKFGDGALGRRRTSLAEAPVIEADALEEPVERLPVTVVCSRQGWVRVLRGHLEDETELKYKEGDGPRFVVRAHSTDRLILISNNGRAYLLPVGRLPGGRGEGEPLRVHVELARGAEALMLAVHRPDGKVLLASGAARGFVADEASIAAQMRSGKQVFNLEEGERLIAAAPAEGDHVATIGTNRKLLIFPLDQLPVMSRGKGVVLQRYKDGKLGDAVVFRLEEGLSWPTAKGTRTLAEPQYWIGKRGQSGRTVPHGFPKSNRFTG
jgi:topoisomerase-4 subunit A